jgi:hypothetical protein
LGCDLVFDVNRAPGAYRGEGWDEMKIFLLRVTQMDIGTKYVQCVAFMTQDGAMKWLREWVKEQDSEFENESVDAYFDTCDDYWTLDEVEVLL